MHKVLAFNIVAVKNCFKLASFLLPTYSLAEFNFGVYVGGFFAGEDTDNFSIKKKSQGP